MAIRYATSDDFNLIIEGIEEIRKSEGYKDTGAKKKDKDDARLAIKNKNIRIIEIKQEPAGYLYFRTNFKILYINEKFLWIQKLYVKKEYRGKDLAKKLYNDAENIAKKKGLKKLYCDVYEVNKRAQKVHKKIGFKPLYAIYEKKI